MRQLTKQESTQVAGSGYWLDTCDIFGCYETYVAEEVWVSGYYLEPMDIVECDIFGCTTYYIPGEWVSGYWAYI